MKIVYIAGPYRGKNAAEVERNIRTAQRYAMALTQAGIAVYSPHLNTAHFDGLQPDQFFLDLGLEMLRRCDALVIAGGGWEKSDGTRREVKDARMLGMIVAEMRGIGGFVDGYQVMNITETSEPIIPLPAWANWFLALPPRRVEVG